MTEKKPVLFTTAAGDSFLFDKGGIRRKEKAKVITEDLPPSDFAVLTSRPWSILDSDSGKKPESSKLIKWSLFVILTVSPAETRYKDWIKLTHALRWIMNP